MSKPPDLSAFPIPRKGGAKPIADATLVGEPNGAGEGGASDATPSDVPDAVPEGDRPAVSRELGRSRGPEPSRPGRPPAQPSPPAPTYGQIVATTVKLDENRYLRLMEAGKPSPGRLKRRTIQDMLIEALDEWFERRRL